jgi:hypothetical protein
MESGTVLPLHLRLVQITTRSLLPFYRGLLSPSDTHLFTAPFEAENQVLNRQNFGDEVNKTGIGYESYRGEIAFPAFRDH